MGVSGPEDGGQTEVFGGLCLGGGRFAADGLSRLLFSGGIEAYVRCEFCGIHARTCSVSVSGKGNLAPEFREELCYQSRSPRTRRP